MQITTAGMAAAGTRATKLIAVADIRYASKPTHLIGKVRWRRQSACLPWTERESISGRYNSPHSAFKSTRNTITL